MIPERWEKCKKEPENRQKGILPRCGWNIGIIRGYQGALPPLTRCVCLTNAYLAIFGENGKRKGFCR